MKTKLSATLLTLTILLPALAGCNDQAQSSQSTTKTTVSLANIERRDLADVVEISAEIEGYQRASLVSRVEAYVKDVMVDIGDEVEANKPLAKLDVPELVAEVTRRDKLLEKANTDLEIRRQEVKQAKACLGEQKELQSLRESQLARIKGLVGRGSLKKEKQEEAQFAVAAVLASMKRCEADVAAAQANVVGAEAEVKVAEAEQTKAIALASYLEIKAPFEGLITQRLVDPGAFVRPANNGGAPLLKIESVKKVRVVLYLPTEDAAKLDVGDEAILYGIDGLSGEQFPGSITRLAKSFERGSRMMRAEVDLPNPKFPPQTGKRKLKPGEYGTVKLTLAKYPDIAIVPQSAIGKSNRGDMIIVVDASNTCRYMLVEVKTVITDGSEIFAGIEGRSQELPRGLRVITKELERFKDGTTLSADELPK